MTVYDNPNQEVVRSDGSGPGLGPEPKDETETEPNPLDSMTKDELLSYAFDRGLEVNSAMTKAEIRDAIDAAE